MLIAALVRALVTDLKPAPHLMARRRPYWCTSPGRRTQDVLSTEEQGRRTRWPYGSPWHLGKGSGVVMGMSASHPSSTGRHGVTRDALSTLQLVARGHSPEEIARLRSRPLVEVLWHLQHALGQFGVVTVRAAIAEARRRGLID